MLLEQASEPGAEMAFERLRAMVEGYSFPQVCRVTISVGYTRINPKDVGTLCLERADAALYYLASVRHIGPRHLIVIGRGLGGTVGANLTLQHPELDRLVMIDPQSLTLGLLQVPRWTHVLPVRLLARDRFNTATALSSRSLDKLFLLSPNVPVPDYVAKATPPATSVHSTALGDAETMAALQRFLAQPHAERNR